MTTSGIVERIDIGRDIGRRQLSVLVDLLFDPFLLQTGEERLSDGIVPAVAASAHAGLQVIGSTEAPPVIAAVLGALVRMNDGATGTPLPDGHHDRVEDEGA